MVKFLSVATLAASLSFSMSVNGQDHKVDFEQIKLEASGRNARHLVSTSNEPTETFAYLYGKAKLVDGKAGTALDFSDTRTRTELRLKTGHFYDHNKGTIGFWISPKKDKFGIKDEAAIFEESNGDTVLGLYITKEGKLKLKVSAKYDIEKKEKEQVYDEKYFANKDNPKIKFDNRDGVVKALDEKKAAEAAAEKAKEDANKPTFTVKDFNFHSFQLGDTSSWKIGEWNHIAVTFDLRRGFFAVLVNGKYAIRSFASEGNSLGTFLDRGDAGKYIVFGPGNNGFSAAIDDIKVSKAVLDKEFDVK